MTVEIKTVSDDETALAHPFVKCLAGLVRAEDRFGIWDKKPDAEMLADFIISKEKRKTIPILGDPDPDVLSRLEWFYAAVALQVEQRTGIMASPIMKMSHEGFGRMLVTAGRLVILNRYLRDVHRFGFPDFAKLAEEGARLADEAADWIFRYRDLALA
ncbi:MAG: NifX-associated nitrogen fixation protein [Rhodospirillaceae bacterium]|nr:NifX-associated nitrogen fixation protein [Rhodospirillaceae bacterium]